MDDFYLVDALFFVSFFSLRSLKSLVNMRNK